MRPAPALKPGAWLGEILRAVLSWVLALVAVFPALIIYAADRLTSCIIKWRGGRD